MKALLALLIVGWSYLLAIVSGTFLNPNQVSPENNQTRYTAVRPLPTQNASVASVPANATSGDETWSCDYFDNPDLSGAPMTSGVRPRLTANWRQGGPVPGLPANGFSMRCVSTRSFPSLDNYRFVLRASGGMRLYIDDRLFINDWFVGVHDQTANISLDGGNHVLRIEYFADASAGAASLAIDWKKTYVGWEGLYFNNVSTEGAPVYKSDDAADIPGGLIFAGDKESRLGIAAENFSAIWRKHVAFQNGTYRFRLRTDGEARVRVNGQLILDTTTQGNNVELDVPVAGGKVLVEVHYANRQGPANVELHWTRTR